jgi:hypothetical protein
MRQLLLWLFLTGPLFSLLIAQPPFPPADSLPEARLSLALAAAQPHPVLGHTTLPFRLDEGHEVLLRIFDAQGKLVKVMINGYLPPGDYSPVFYHPGYPPGVYLYQLEIDQLRYAGKLLLLQ